MPIAKACGCCAANGLYCQSSFSGDGVSGWGCWRCCFFSYAQLRQAVLLSDADQVALTSQDPFAAAVAASSLIAGAMPLLAGTLARISGLAAVIWIVSITPGRGIITRMIVRRFAADSAVGIAADAPRWASFAMLNFARILMLLILVVGYLGGSLIAALVSGPEEGIAASSLIVFTSLAIAFAVWSYANWVLSLAPVLVVRDGLVAIGRSSRSNRIHPPQPLETHRRLRYGMALCAV